VGNELIEKNGTNLITFTGSTEAGLKIAARAATHGKRMILEMRGMDPFIVLEDADLQIAADAALKGCFTYSDQICTIRKI
jgi:acyl-CoA reductase-like NAD-dependent aldehyde dehydrogenase